MGKDRDGTFHPSKGKPSGADKEEYSPDVQVRHPNRNTSKNEIPGGRESKAERTRQQAFNENFSKTEPEELLGILTKDLFIQLSSYDQAPCVSILLPTHHAGVEVNEQADLMAFRNSLQEVEKILAQKHDTILIKRMLEPAYELVKSNSFWRDLTDGLAVYFADGYFKYLRLPGTVSPQVRVNSSFYVSPLIPFMVKKEEFFLLDLAKKKPRFYRADAFGIEHLEIEEMPDSVADVVHFEEKDGDNLFRTGGRGGTGGANFHGIGGGKPDEKQNIAAYFEEVDDTIWKTHLHNATAPLLLSGIDYLLPIYRSVSDYKNIWPEALTGNHKFQNDAELYREAMQVMLPYFNRNRDRWLEDFANKIATALTSSMVDAIIPAAYYGRIAQLFVKKDYKVWGSFDEAANKLNVTGMENGEAEDLVDRAVIKTIQNGGEVFILEENQMPRSSEIAAIFRY